MRIKLERVLHKVGEDSYAVTLPKAWITANKLKVGDTVEIIINDDIVIRAKTMLKTGEETKS